MQSTWLMSDIFLWHNYALIMQSRLVFLRRWRLLQTQQSSLYIMWFHVVVSIIMQLLDSCKIFLFSNYFLAKHTLRLHSAKQWKSRINVSRLRRLHASTNSTFQDTSSARYSLSLAEFWRGRFELQPRAEPSSQSPLLSTFADFALAMR